MHRYFLLLLFLSMPLSLYSTPAYHEPIAERVLPQEPPQKQPKKKIKKRLDKGEQDKEKPNHWAFILLGFGIALMLCIGIFLHIFAAGAFFGPWFFLVELFLLLSLALAPLFPRLIQKKARESTQNKTILTVLTILLGILSLAILVKLFATAVLMPMFFRIIIWYGFGSFTGIVPVGMVAIGVFMIIQAIFIQLPSDNEPKVSSKLKSILGYIFHFLSLFLLLPFGILSLSYFGVMTFLFPPVFMIIGFAVLMLLYGFAIWLKHSQPNYWRLAQAEAPKKTRWVGIALLVLSALLFVPTFIAFTFLALGSTWITIVFIVAFFVALVVGLIFILPNF